MTAVDVIVLLGWMKPEVAVAFLRERCAFASPLTTEEATDLWTRQRRLVERLPARPARETVSIRMSPQEEISAARFLAEQTRVEGVVRAVVKVDPAQLRVRQLGVTLDRCEYFDRSCRTRQQWIDQWLTPSPTSMQGRVRATANAIDVELPHPEFVLGFDPAAGFQIVEGPRYVTVKRGGSSMTLMAGHHRAYAYLRSAGSDQERSILAAELAHSVPTAEGSTAVMEGAEDVCERCPPTMADFLDDRHAVRLEMRPRRFELQIRARMAVVPGEPRTANREPANPRTREPRTANSEPRTREPRIANSE
jgi:hypothetical protein